MERDRFHKVRTTGPDKVFHAFCIDGWAAWAPGRESETAWRAWAMSQTSAAGAPSDAASDSPTVTPLPLMLRRRVSPLGQAALRAAWGLPGLSSSRLICASRHGEFGRTLSILDSLMAGTDVSPADFTLSVHHALIGLLSIAAQNREGHTAVAAGKESFGHALLEAAACLAEAPQTPITLVYYDEPLPAPFDRFNEAGETPFAAAFHLTANGPGEHLMFAASPASGHAPQSLPQALGFLRFILNDDDERLSPGDRLDWLWKRDAAAA